MPRTVSIRISYANDAGYCTRMVQAVEKDTTLARDLQEKLLHHYRELAMLLIQADQRRKVRSAG